MTEIDMTHDNSSHATVDCPDNNSTTMCDNMTVDTIIANYNCPLSESGEKKEHEPCDTPQCSDICLPTNAKIQFPQSENKNNKVADHLH